jgi:hypothetical protein
MMTSTAKVSVAIGRDELAWAKTLARREGKSLSAIVTESLAERRRHTALAEVVAWMGEGQPRLTEAELEAARRAMAEGASTSTARRPPRAASTKARALRSSRRR